MSGVLYLIPNTLGDGDAAALDDVLPAPVRARAAAPRTQSLTCRWGQVLPFACPGGQAKGKT